MKQRKNYYLQANKNRESKFCERKNWKMVFSKMYVNGELTLSTALEPLRDGGDVLSLVESLLQLKIRGLP